MGWLITGVVQEVVITDSRMTSLFAMCTNYLTINCRPRKFDVPTARDNVFFFRRASEHFQKACPPDNHEILSQCLNIYKGKRSLRHGPRSKEKQIILNFILVFYKKILILKE